MLLADLFLETWDRIERRDIFILVMAAQRESSVEASEWAGISESGDDDMDFEVGGFAYWDSFDGIARGEVWEWADIGV